MITAKNLMEIEELIGRWEQGDAVWSDPPLCSLLVGEVARLRRLLRDLYPFVAGTPMQEEVAAEVAPASDLPSPPKVARAARPSRCRALA